MPFLACSLIGYGPYWYIVLPMIRLTTDSHIDQLHDSSQANRFHVNSREWSCAFLHRGCHSRRKLQGTYRGKHTSRCQCGILCWIPYINRALKITTDIDEYYIPVKTFELSCFLPIVWSFSWCWLWVTYCSIIILQRIYVCFRNQTRLTR